LALRNQTKRNGTFNVFQIEKYIKISYTQFFSKFGDPNAILSYAQPLDSSSNQLATGAIVECQHHGSRPETSSLILLWLRSSLSQPPLTLVCTKKKAPQTSDV